MKNKSSAQTNIQFFFYFRFSLRSMECEWRHRQRRKVKKKKRYKQVDCENCSVDIDAFCLCDRRFMETIFATKCFWRTHFVVVIFLLFFCLPFSLFIRLFHFNLILLHSYTHTRRIPNRSDESSVPYWFIFICYQNSNALNRSNKVLVSWNRRWRFDANCGKRQKMTRKLKRE